MKENECNVCKENVIRGRGVLKRPLKALEANISRNIVAGDAKLTNFGVELRNSSTSRFASTGVDVCINCTCTGVGVRQTLACKREFKSRALPELAPDLRGITSTRQQTFPITD